MPSRVPEAWKNSLPLVLGAEYVQTHAEHKILSVLTWILWELLLASPRESVSSRAELHLHFHSRLL